MTPTLKSRLMIFMVTYNRQMCYVKSPCVLHCKNADKVDYPLFFDCIYPNLMITNPGPELSNSGSDTFDHAFYLVNTHA